MPTKILDLDLEDLPDEVDGLERYDRVLALFREHGKPVGQGYVTIQQERCQRTLLEAAAQKRDGLRMPQLISDKYLVKNRPATLANTETFKRLPPTTIAVCTHDRTDDLRNCLHSLLSMPDDGQEILVIDNCPTSDATRALVSSFAGRIHYCCEPRKGLDIARNRALCEAHGEIVAFIDDDAVADPNWLRALLANFDDPSVLCVTGLTMPLELENDAQEWFEAYYPFGRGFDRIVYDRTRINPLQAGKCGAGVNMAVRRSIVQTVGVFEERLDSGTATLSGGDTEMYMRILESGYKIVYDPASINWHRHRRTWQELEKTAFGYGTGIYAFWTHLFCTKHRFRVLIPALLWLLYPRLPQLMGALLRRQHKTLFRLILAETLGCFYGPFAYYRSTRAQTRQPRGR